MAAMAQQFFNFGLGLRESVLPNDQFPREARGFGGGEFVQDIEWHAGHSD